MFSGLLQCHKPTTDRVILCNVYKSPVLSTQWFKTATSESRKQQVLTESRSWILDSRTQQNSAANTDDQKSTEPHKELCKSSQAVQQVTRISSWTQACNKHHLTWNNHLTNMLLTNSWCTQLLKWAFTLIVTALLQSCDFTHGWAFIPSGCGSSASDQTLNLVLLQSCDLAGHETSFHTLTQDRCNHYR